MSLMCYANYVLRGYEMCLRRCGDVARMFAEGMPSANSRHRQDRDIEMDTTAGDSVCSMSLR